MKFCCHCGASLEIRVPAGDNRPRYVCGNCDHIHYQNPKIVAGCLAVFNQQVLLCKRSIEPRSGFWTLPAGYMENGESVQQAAVRETLEEACAEVEIQGLYTISNLLAVNQIQMLFLARLPEPKFSAGHETLEARLFNEDEIPWETLAFQTIRIALRSYFEDRKTDTYPLRHFDLAMKLDPKN